jgi:hypothetical protein
MLRKHAMGAVLSTVQDNLPAFIVLDVPIPFLMSKDAVERRVIGLGRDHGLLPRLDHRNSPLVERGGELVVSVGQSSSTTSFSC